MGRRGGRERLSRDRLSLSSKCFPRSQQLVCRFVMQLHTGKVENFIGKDVSNKLDNVILDPFNNSVFV